jgi:hypothetical protein
MLQTLGFIAAAAAASTLVIVIVIELFVRVNDRQRLEGARVRRVRYYGGMPQLLRAFGESEEFWPSVSEMTGEDIEALMSMPLAESVSAVLINFARALRRRPITLEIMAWELVEQNELTEVLREVRENMSIKLFHEFSAKFGDVDADIAAMVTLLSAATMMVGSAHPTAPMMQRWWWAVPTLL